MTWQFHRRATANESARHTVKITWGRDIFNTERCCCLYTISSLQCGHGLFCRAVEFQQEYKSSAWTQPMEVNLVALWLEHFITTGLLGIPPGPWSCSLWPPCCCSVMQCEPHDSKTPNTSCVTWPAQQSDNFESRVVWTRHNFTCLPTIKSLSCRETPAENKSWHHSLSLAVIHHSSGHVHQSDHDWDHNRAQLGGHRRGFNYPSIRYIHQANHFHFQQMRMKSLWLTCPVGCDC